MNFRNLMKESVLAMVGPDDQPKVKRLASEMRRQIKARNLKETPFLTVRIHAALVSLVWMLRAQKQVMSPDAPFDAFEQWQKATEALQKATEEFENGLDKLDKTVPATEPADASTPSLDNAEETVEEKRLENPLPDTAAPDFDELLSNLPENVSEGVPEPCGVA